MALTDTNMSLVDSAATQASSDASTPVPPNQAPSFSGEAGKSPAAVNSDNELASIPLPPDPPVAAPKPPKKKGRVKITEPDRWTKPTDKLPFRPFEKINRGGQWAVSEEGKHWISQRIPSYSKMRPPAGLPKIEGSHRYQTQRQWWSKKLVKDYMENWPEFNAVEVLGLDPTLEEAKLQSDRVIKFIDYAVLRQHAAKKESPSDILSLLINRVRKPIAYNHWAQQVAEVDTDARKIAEKDVKWKDLHERLHLLMEARKKLFLELNEEEQQLWEKSAQDSKNNPISAEDCISLIPKIYGLIGDSIRKLVHFNCIVLCGGKGLEPSPSNDGASHAVQGPWFYSEEWHHPSIEDPLGFTSTENWSTIQGTFLHTLSKETAVKLTEIAQLPTWQRPSEYIPKHVERLSDILKFDNNGELVSSLETARQATEKYLDALYSLVPDRNGGPQSKPIPWTHVYRAGLKSTKYVDPEHLPSPDFFFLRPKDQPEQALLSFIRHIVQGEKGELPPERIFRWTNQTDGNFQLSAKPRKQTRTSGHKSKKRRTKTVNSARDPSSECEFFNLGDISSSETESEDEKPRGRLTSQDQKAGRARSVAAETKPKPAAKEKKAVKQGKAKEVKAKGAKASTTTAKSRSAKEPKAKAKQTDKTAESKERSTSRVPCKRNPLPNSKRKQTDNEDTADSATDVIDEYQVLFSGGATQLYVGDASRWEDDFATRQAALDWENDESLEFGATTIESARFIESGERFPDMTFYKILDMGQPISSFDETIAETIFDINSPLPDASDITADVTWQPVLDTILGRIDKGIHVIMQFSPATGHRWLRLGNANGIMLLLRLTEFARRVAIHQNDMKMHEQVSSIRSTLNVVLAKEAWRRWARASFQVCIPVQYAATRGDLFLLWDIWMATQMQNTVTAEQWSELKWRRFLSPDTMLERVASETCLTARGDEERATTLTLTANVWKMAATLTEVQDWVTQMDESTFLRGCVIERFQYIYAVQMGKWWGGEAACRWTEPAVTALEDWMAKDIHKIDASQLPKHRRYFGSKRFLVAPQIIRKTPGSAAAGDMSSDKPPNSKLDTAAHGSIEDEREGTPECADLAFPPQQLEMLPASPAVARINPLVRMVDVAMNEKPSGRAIGNAVTAKKAGVGVLDSLSSDGDVEEMIVTPGRKRKSGNAVADNESPMKKQKVLEEALVSAQRGDGGANVAKKDPQFIGDTGVGDGATGVGGIGGDDSMPNPAEETGSAGDVAVPKTGRRGRKPQQKEKPNAAEAQAMTGGRRKRKAVDEGLVGESGGIATRLRAKKKRSEREEKKEGRGDKGEGMGQVAEGLPKAEGVEQHEAVQHNVK
ncbi:hypothetical protein M422DRAFT_274624 [Sphaerobolus stellatus SS14]|uniref:Unplaced genomic scaffold SPHSTscaffold_402, whole genome shotgun sequence n=1 Tax=Sphaerobolus stellatus (strain SS14) TaxID=990650 RepID=A0A0C9U615_SPHS4|nr:hypothetical protein M422DRAFT_274624 [Sphaerobolus stellatus SS14]